MTYISFARLFGILYVVVALGVLFNMDNTKRVMNELLESATNRMLAGVLPLFFGAWILVQHNDWSLSWALVVTLLGWLMLFMGVFRLWFVELWLKLIRRNEDKVSVLFGFFSLMLGLLLLFVGFWVR